MKFKNFYKQLSISDLGTKCKDNSECTIQNSICEMSDNEQVCKCKEGFTEDLSTNTTCLESKFIILFILTDINKYFVFAVIDLGEQCKNQEECQRKDLNSGCIDGICKCLDTHVEYNKQCHLKKGNMYLVILEVLHSERKKFWQ